MKRRFQALVGDATVLTPFPLLRQPIATSPGRRTFQRAATACGNPRTTSSEPAAAPSTGWATKRQEWLDSRGVRPANKPAEEDVDLDFVVRKHLKYLKDPLKLAEHVRRTLREGDVDTTLAVVRGASKSMQCTVSWNHLIEWHLSQGKMKAAIRIYNEVWHICWPSLNPLLTVAVKMKKRAQAPDARTYTIIFNGAANHPSANEALGRVLSIYQSMLLDRSPVRPNTIHVNAILKMCARAQNMEAMFAIADQLPPKGLRAPNNLTFTTIINALRIYAVNDLRSTLTPIQKNENRRQAMLDARRIWQDVSKRWQQGDLWIDEELACAMGRVLLLGAERDHDDILSLVEQTMNIRRQAPRLPIPGQKNLIETGGRGSSATSEAGDLKPRPRQRELDAANISQGAAADGTQSQEAVSSEDEPGTTQAELDAAFMDQFQSVLPTTSSLAPAGAYAKPGSNTLSLLMQSILFLRLKEPATKYWDLLTKEYGVRPDAENYHAYLRVLRVARASGDAVKLLIEMPRSYLQPKTFRIAMSTCLRDKKNRNVFANSGKILDIMQDTLEIPDMVALHTYLDLAMVAPLSDKVASGTARELQYAQGRQIIRALERLGPSFVNIRSLLVYGDTSGANNESRADFLQDVLALARKMISAHDTLIHKDLVPTSLHGDLIKQRSKLTAFVTRFKRDKRQTTPPIKLEDKHEEHVESKEDEQRSSRDDHSEPRNARPVQQAPRA